MLRWSAKKLSEMSGVSLPTIQRMESVPGVPKSISTNLQTIQRTLEDAGVIFIDEDDEGPGVRLKKSRMRQGG
jgi:hypothetical protein